MKNINKSIGVGIILLVMTIFVGCTDSLTRLPGGSISNPDQISPSDIEKYLLQIYTNLDISETDDAWTDNGYTRNFWDGPGASIQNGSLNSGTESTYIDRYKSIRICNDIILNIDNLPVSDEEKMNYKAEARVTRAMAYTTLILYYKDVPLITENEYSNSIVAPEVAPFADVKDYVISELKDAIEILPAQNIGGRLNKYSVMGLLARSAYYFGDYSLAEEYSKKVIAEGPYSISKIIVENDRMQMERDFIKNTMMVNSGLSEAEMEDFLDGVFAYESIWRFKTNCPEVMIQSEYLAQMGAANGGIVWTHYCSSFLPPQAKWGWATVVPIVELADSYWTSDGHSDHMPLANREKLYREANAEIENLMKSENNGLGKNITYQQVLADPNLLSQVDLTILDDYKNRDSRFYASIIYPFALMNQIKEGYRFQFLKMQNETITGLCWKKKTPLPEDIIAGDGWGYASVNMPRMRLAEMLLIYAEAHTINDGYDESVMLELNKLRNRVGMPDVPSGLSKNDALDFIRRERRIELAGEGFRSLDVRLYEDVTRNGGYKGKEAASAVMVDDIYSVDGTSLNAKVWYPNLLFLPYPQEAVDKNEKLKPFQSEKGY